MGWITLKNLETKGVLRTCVPTLQNGLFTYEAITFFGISTMINPSRPHKPKSVHIF